MAAATCCSYRVSLLPPITTLPKKQLSPFYAATKPRLAGPSGKKRAVRRTTCAIGLEDFIGGDLVKFDLGQWLSDVGEHKALAIYSPHEVGYEGHYLTRLRYQGFQCRDLSARGLGDL